MREFRFCLFVCLGGVTGCLCCYLCMSLTIYSVCFSVVLLFWWGGVVCLFAMFVCLFVKKQSFCMFAPKLIQCEKYNSV